MKRKSAIIVAILIMCIGFASISTTLIINGSTKVSENVDDFSVIFTKATLDGIDVYANVIDDTKKIITFETSDLKTLNQTSVLTYEVTNNSSNYDAEVQINCKVKDNTEAKYTSIKNELNGNATKVLAKNSLNGTLMVTLNKTATEEVKEEYVCELTFNAVERDMVGVAPINLYNMIKNNADTTTIIDYSIRSGADGKETNGIYTTTATEGNVLVYYYRGKVDNNIIFGDYCWKIIRTTETGGIKLIYNGTPTDGRCETQIGEATQIGTSSWNIKSDDAAYVGYMFGINNTGNSTSKEEAQTNTYDSTIKVYLEDWFKNNMLAYENHLEDTAFCNDRSTVTGGNNNTLDSTFKDLGYGTTPTGFGALARSSYFTTIPNPSLTCIQINDKFTVDTQNGNGKLTYPIGLITTDEAILAGYNTNASNSTDYKNIDNYLFSGNTYLTFSPIDMNTVKNTFIGGIYSTGYIGGVGVSQGVGIRPVISLKSGTFIEPNGEGTPTSPYTVK